MIKTKSDMNLLTEKGLRNLTDDECRLLLYNYIFYTTGRKAEEIFTATIGSSARYAVNVHKAFRYFRDI